MLDLTTIGHTVYAYLSTEKIAYKYTPATEKTNKSGEKTYTAIRNAKEEEISIRWHDDQNGQHLTLWKNESLAATFTLTNDKKMLWQPQEIYSKDEDLTAKPSNPKNVPIVSTSLYNFFQTWINSYPFSLYLDSLSREQVYPPSLVKLLILFISYLNVRTKTAASLGGKLTADLDSKIDDRQVAKIFNLLIAQVVGDSPHMVRMYSDSATYLLPAVEKVEGQVTSAVENTDNTPVEVAATSEEAPKLIDVVSQTDTINITATEPKKVEDKQPKKDPSTEMLERLAAKKQSEAKK